MKMKQKLSYILGGFILGVILTSVMLIEIGHKSNKNLPIASQESSTEFLTNTSFKYYDK